MSQGHTSICRLSCNIIYDTNPSYFMACSCLSLMDFQLYLGSFSISTPSPAWIAAARGKARGFAGEARSLLASEKNLLITPPKTIKNAQGFAGMVDPRTRPVISRFPYVYIYVCVCGNWSKWESAYYRCLHNSNSTIGNTKYGNGLRIFALIDLLEISWKRMTAASRNRKAEKHKSSEAGKTKSKKAGKQKREKQEKQKSRRKQNNGKAGKANKERSRKA